MLIGVEYFVQWQIMTGHSKLDIGGALNRRFKGIMYQLFEHILSSFGTHWSDRESLWKMHHAELKYFESFPMR